MSGKKVYIENLRKYSSTFTVLETVEVAGDNGKKVKVERPAKDIEFVKRSTDPATGAVITSGFTAIDPDDYDALIKQSRVFEGFVLSGEYVKFDEIPAEAQSASDLVNKYANDLASANARIAELEALVAKGSSDAAVLDLQKKNETLAKANETLSADLESAKAKVTELQAALDKSSEGGL